jgi:CBS domain-containing protein
MTAKVETIEPEAPPSEAARRMTEGKIGCLVVVEGERLVGILTEGDFVKLMI